MAAAAARLARPDRGATGAGEGSIIWSLIRALLPGILGVWVRVWAGDPKRMELSFGRDLFARYADQAAEMVELLEAAVAEMHRRAAAQRREGWHLETEPVIEPGEPTEDQKWWVEKRAEAQPMRDQAEHGGQDTAVPGVTVIACPYGHAAGTA